VKSQEILDILESRSPRRLLAIPFEDGSLAESLGRVLPATELGVLQKQDLAGISLPRLFRKLRSERWDVAICSLYRSTVNRSRSGVELIAGIIRADSRYVRVGEDEYVKVDLLHVASTILPRLLLGFVLGVVSVVGMYGTNVVGRFYTRQKWKNTFPSQGTVMFLRTDLAGDLTAGGSISHIKGMINAFLEFGYRVVYVGDARIDGLASTVVQEIVSPIRLLDFLDEFQLAAYNFQFLIRSRGWLLRYNPVLIYQRHGILNFSGGLLAKRGKIPFVLEANASEVWVKSNWSRLVFKGLARRSEHTALRLAERVTVISQGVREQLAPYHLPDSVFVQNPNGVDPTEFHPSIDGTLVRHKYVLGRNIVVGFIGTFTKWHGVEILCEAAMMAVKNNERVAFLLIGDGDLKSFLESRVRTAGLENRIVFTGLIPHSQAPQHLAACDILVSPHLGFGSTEKFFGSPTKLFEYMAMGKAIVASNLEQLGEVIEDGKTGLHCEPGNPTDLTEKVLMLVTDEGLRARLGRDARFAAVQKYTWRHNVDRIIQSLSM